MKRLSLASLAILSILALVGWGPVSHVHIAKEATKSLYYTTAQRNAVVWGSVAPDSWLIQQGSGVIHTMLHAQVFYDSLKRLAVTAEEKAFVRGYNSHLVSDPIERAYTSTKPYFGVPGELLVDIMLAKKIPSLSYVKVIPTTATKSLMIRAWQATYSGYAWQPTGAFLDSAARTFNSWISMAGWGSVSGAVRLAYADYYSYIQLSIAAARSAP